MSQKRYWSYKDDDATADINRWLTGLITSGLYHGFDFNPTANMNLNLVHTSTGFKDVDAAETESGFQSLIVTRAGAVIKESAAITINGVAAGDATHGRIDVVVLSHEYITTVGGATALYSIITGTPSASPVAPALTDTARQIKIGELFIPANTTALNGGGVTWTRATGPIYAGIDFIGSRTYTTQNFITNGQLITASLDALDIALKAEQTSRINNDNSETSARIAADAALAALIGNQTYTAQNILTNSESITASLNKLDQVWNRISSGISDLNAVHQSGLYSISSADVNGPGLVADGIMIVHSYSGHAVIQQTIYDLSNGSMWTRKSVNTGSTYTAWTLTDTLNAKKLQPAWVNITLVNGWASGDRTAQYLIDNMGMISLRGNLDASGASSDIFSTTMPHPSATVKEYISSPSSSYEGHNPARTPLSISAGGQAEFLSVSFFGTNLRAVLDGVTYWT